MDKDTSAGPHPMRETYVPLGGTRSHTTQRLQIGLSGLGAMLLLVGLANVIMDRAQESDEQSVPEAAATTVAAEAAGPASDPLADAGVVPDLPASPVPTPPAAAAPGARNAAQPATSRP